MEEVAVIKKRNYILKFKHSAYRRDEDTSNFDGVLTPYWEKQYEDMFRGWSEDG